MKAIVSVFIMVVAVVVNFYYAGSFIVTTLHTPAINWQVQNSNPKQQVNPVEEQNSSVVLRQNDGSPLRVWRGDRHLNYGDLYTTVKYVVDHSPVTIEDEEGFISLIIETVAVESFFGKSVKQKKGPALGIFQMEPVTYTCIQDNFIKYHDNYKKFILSFKDRSLSNHDNLMYNVKYQVAYALIHYVRYNVHELDLSDRNDRASTYKDIWNTYKGKATIEKFVEDTNKYLSEYYNV